MSEELTLLKREKLSSLNADFIEQKIKSGQILPCQKEKILAFMDSFDEAETFDFAEDKPSKLAFFKEFVNELPSSVNFSEVASVDKNPIDWEDANALVVAAKKYQAEQNKMGRNISFSDAVTELKQ